MRSSSIDSRYLEASIQIDEMEKEIIKTREEIQLLQANINSSHTNMEARRLELKETHENELQVLSNEILARNEAERAIHEHYTLQANENSIIAHIDMNEALINERRSKKRKYFAEEIQKAMELYRKEVCYQFEQEISRHLLQDESKHEECLKEIIRDHKKRLDDLEMLS